MEGSSSEIRRSQSLKDLMQRLGFLSFLPSRRQQGTGLHGAVEAVKLSTGEVVAIKTVESGAQQADSAQIQAERQLLQRLCHTCASLPIQFSACLRQGQMPMTHLKHHFVDDVPGSLHVWHLWRRQH